MLSFYRVCSIIIPVHEGVATSHYYPPPNPPRDTIIFSFMCTAKQAIISTIAEWMDGWMFLRQTAQTGPCPRLLCYTCLLVVFLLACLHITQTASLTYESNSDTFKPFHPTPFFSFDICMDPCLTYRWCTHASKMQAKKQRSS